MAFRILAGMVGLSVTVLAVDRTSGDHDPQSDDRVVWRIDNLKQIGGHNVRVAGNPRVVDAAEKKAVEFDGRDDALFLDVHPLAGAKQFTVEVIFRPDAGGPAEQRFFHMQENGSDDRVLFETRLTGDGQWFLDTFIKSGKGDYTLFAEKFKHPVGRWYHAAIVVDGEEMRHYVNGKLEMATKIAYQPQRAGKTSLGVRINKVFWFKGAIRTARFTRRVLEPKEFLNSSHVQNRKPKSETMNRRQTALYRIIHHEDMSRRFVERQDTSLCFCDVPLPLIANRRR